LPATGHALAMFNSVLNFAELFRGGPVHRDSLRMRGTFGDAAVCGHLVTAIPEEMPLREALEGVEQLNEYFPSNAPAFVLNRRFPAVPVDAAKKPPAEQPDSWPSPIADGAVDFAVKRRLLEDYNLRLWEDAGILKKARVLPQIPLPRQKRADGAVVDALAAEIKSWGLG
ncbi:MAG TPA: hypothetical protein VL588_08705, partial [Bdellovibrionota bacterium]|nr:hypothetical protein [Bdellovibrionota bacterium]